MNISLIYGNACFSIGVGVGVGVDATVIFGLTKALRKIRRPLFNPCSPNIAISGLNISYALKL